MLFIFLLVPTMTKAEKRSKENEPTLTQKRFDLSLGPHLPSDEKHSMLAPHEAFSLPLISSIEQETANHDRASLQTALEPPFSTSGPWQFLFMPSLNFTSDEGLGAGLTFSIFRKDELAAQLREELRLRLFVTSKFSHQHEISWLIRKIGDLPLRLQTRVGFFSTRSAHFCGLGPEVTCADREALQAYRNLLQEGAPQDLSAPWSQAEFMRQYFLRRYFSPYFRLLFHWQPIHSWPLEFIFGWNLAYQQTGAPDDQSAFPFNRYSEVFPNGEVGRQSTLRVGILFEDVDLEAWPTRGHRALLLVRAADVWTGSSWQFYGAHADWIGYFQFPKTTASVVAVRILYDEIQGYAPSLELSQVTGLQDVSAFGGPWLGRGIRERRFNGHQKLIQQSEYRVPLATLRILPHRLGLALAAFYDVAWVRFAPQNQREDAASAASDRWLLGVGLGMRLLIDRVFLFRMDLAASPHERQGPFLYVVMGAPF